MNKIRRKCLLSWQIPSIGFGLNFLLGLGLSYSNQDIRSDVQSVGLVVFSVLVLIGSYYTVRAFRSYQRYRNKNYLKYAIAGLLVNLSIVFFVVTSVSKIQTLSHPLNTTKHSLAEFKPSSNSKLPIWIDTDPACGQSATSDVDDCWALMLALRSPELHIRGISTTFGNTKGETALQVARQVIRQLGGASQSNRTPPIFQGSHSSGSPEWKSTQASSAIAAALRQEKVTITRSDLDKLGSGDAAAQWLRQASQAWMSFWEDRLHKQGFHPFDALAVGYVTMPDLFSCEILPARIGFSIFLEPFGLGHDLEVAPDLKGSQVYYCSDVEPRFKDKLIDRLISHQTVTNNL